MNKPYFVEIWRKGSSVPLIEYFANEVDAERLYNSAANEWSLRRYGKSGAVIREERAGRRAR